jgi:hypothetical protein
MIVKATPIRAAGLRIHPLIVVLAASLLPALLLAHTYPGTVDDSFISYRYAYNLVHGRGLVFNPGEYVEGYTNLLWTLLMALPIAAGYPVGRAAAVLGFAFGVGAALEMWRAARVFCARSAAWVALLALIGCGNFWLTVVNGLEGGLVALLAAHLLALTARKAAPWRIGLAGGLLFLTRPDTLVLAPIYALWLLAAGRPEPAGAGRRALLAALGPWLLIAGALTLWRLFYYGALIPNTITAKAAPGDLPTVAENLRLGAKYIGDFFSSAPLFIFALLLAPLAVDADRFAALPVALVAGYSGVILLNGGDWMPAFRLLAVYAPLLALLLALALGRIRERFSGRAYGSVAALAALSVGCTAVLAPTVPWNPAGDLKLYSSSCYANVADRVRPLLRPGDVLAPDAAGEFSYLLPDNPIHDMWGLTDRHIAKNGTYGRYYGRVDRAYTFGTVRPHLIVIHGDLWHFEELSRVSGGAFERAYTVYDLVGISRLPDCGARIMVAVRNDAAARLAPAFRDLDPAPLKLGEAR